MSEIQRGIQAIAQEPTNRPVIKRFFRFFAAVAVIPVCVYILTIRLTYLTSSPPISPPILAGIAAVFSLNLLISFFALLAVFEQSPTPSVAPRELSTVADEQISSHEKDE